MSTVTTNTAGNPYLSRAYCLKNAEEASTVYDEWATTFDSDMNDPAQDYVAPALTAAAAAKAVDRQILVNGDILDAGCGTGLVGVAMSQLGSRKIDGLDISAKMLDVARKTGAYRDLAVADLTKSMAASNASYDIIVCAGTLTHGHVGPGALSEFARVLRSGGVVAATVLDDIWESGGFRAEVDRLVEAGQVRMVSCDIEDYRRGASVKARMLVLRKTTSA